MTRHLFAAGAALALALLAVSRDAAAHLESLKAASERIATLQTQLPAPIDPQLAHYLQRCSYDKALAFIEGL
jgi:hypothetical protein